MSGTENKPIRAMLFEGSDGTWSLQVGNGAGIEVALSAMRTMAMAEGAVVVVEGPDWWILKHGNTVVKAAVFDVPEAIAKGSRGVYGGYCSTVRFGQESDGGIKCFKCNESSPGPWEKGLCPRCGTPAEYEPGWGPEGDEGEGEGEGQESDGPVGSGHFPNIGGAERFRCGQCGEAFSISGEHGGFNPPETFCPVCGERQLSEDKGQGEGEGHVGLRMSRREAVDLGLVQGDGWKATTDEGQGEGLKPDRIEIGEERAGRLHDEIRESFRRRRAEVEGQGEGEDGWTDLVDDPAYQRAVRKVHGEDQGEGEFQIDTDGNYVGPHPCECRKCGHKWIGDWEKNCPNCGDGQAEVDELAGLVNGAVAIQLLKEWLAHFYSGTMPGEVVTRTSDYLRALRRR